MNKEEIFQKAQTFQSAILINRFPYALRAVVTLLSVVAAVVSLVDLFLLNLLPVLAQRENSFLMSLSTVVGPLLGYEKVVAAIFFGSVSAAFLFLGINSFAAYFYLQGVRRVFEKRTNTITYEVAKVYRNATPTLKDLIVQKESSAFLERMLVNESDMVSRFGAVALPETIPTNEAGIVTLGTVWRAVYEENKTIQEYFLSYTIQKKNFFFLTAWMDRVFETKKVKIAWWWRENLSKKRGFAKTLSYGTTGYLSRYASEMIFDRKLREVGEVILHDKECLDLEEVLSKHEGANAVIVGKEGSGRYTIALILAQRIFEGTVYAEIEHKRMFLVNAKAFDLINDKVSFENTWYSLLSEAALARNIILVIDDITKIVDDAARVSVDFWSLLDPYTKSPALSFVILTDEHTYSRPEYKRAFEQTFQKIMLRDIGEELFLPYLEDRALATERKTGVFFAYTALSVIAETLPVFFTEESPLVKGAQIIDELALTGHSKEPITGEHVREHLKSLTGVSLGKISEEEKENLLNLESVLSRYVMGQESAVTSVAKTMRRVRSGIADREKPMGTFLFLGPTGSGKTETAKTLAKVFFGGEENMSRIDMGEYSVPQSSRRLLGDENTEGDLASLVHSRPHGVLLLDEFEKSSADVKDVFLRVLDEGVFTTGQGKTVSLRTQIIIATSNAGADVLRGLVTQSATINAEEVKDTIISTVLERGVFKPELVNRFDATVMFLPLGKEAMGGVANKMLGELAKRIEDRGYKVEWSKDVVDTLLASSDAAEFGGRAIQRAIQDNIEDSISKRMISGELQPGGTIILSKEDIFR